PQEGWCRHCRCSIGSKQIRNTVMLSWDDEVTPTPAAQPQAGLQPAVQARTGQSDVALDPSLITKAAAAANPMQRMDAADKRVINGQTDVNQLVPFKYKWEWDKYLAGCANHWMPQEINMQ